MSKRETLPRGCDSNSGVLTIGNSAAYTHYRGDNRTSLEPNRKCVLGSVNRIYSGCLEYTLRSHYSSVNGVRSSYADCIKWALYIVWGHSDICLLCPNGII